MPKAIAANRLCNRLDLPVLPLAELECLRRLVDSTNLDWQFCHRQNSPLAAKVWSRFLVQKLLGPKHSEILDSLEDSRGSRLLDCSSRKEAMRNFSLALGQIKVYFLYVLMTMWLLRY